VLASSFIISLLHDTRLTSNLQFYIFLFSTTNLGQRERIWAWNQILSTATSRQRENRHRRRKTQRSKEEKGIIGW